MPLRLIIVSVLGVAFILIVFVSVRPIFKADTSGSLEANISVVGTSALSSNASESDIFQEKPPMRIWDVLDPSVSAEAVLIQSLDDGFPFLSHNTYKSWPIASLTKILAAVVVLENFQINERIPISEVAVSTEGEAGSLRSGEAYSVRDLAQIMLLTSSNDAAAAFEEYAGGKEQFAELLNAKAVAIGMASTVVYDGSGLSDGNVSS